MEIKIGVTNINREISIESEITAAELTKKLKAAMDGGLLEIDGANGRRLAIPASQIGYLDMGSEHPRPVGFSV